MKNKFLILSLISFNFLIACSNDHNSTGPNPDHSGPNPDHSGPNPDHSGPNPDHSGPNPDHSGPNPDHSGPNPDHSGLNPDHDQHQDKIEEEIIPTCMHEFRGAFDIGSGATKIQLARVEVCGHEITQVDEIYRADASVKYGEELAHRKDNEISMYIVNKIGIKAIDKLSEKAEDKLKIYCKKNSIDNNSCQVKKWRGIATEAFRKAKNWEIVLKALSERTLKYGQKISIKLLDQDQEAYFGYYPITQLPGFEPDRSIVWDLGGGSSQFTIFNHDFDAAYADTNKTKMILLPLGTSSFKNLYKNTLKIQPNKSINPIIGYSDHHKDCYVRNNVNKVQKEFTKIFEQGLKKSNIEVNSIQDFAGKKVYVIGGTLSRLIPTTYKKKISVNQISKIKKITDIIPYTFHTKDIINKILNLDDTGLKRNFGTAIPNESYRYDMPINLLLTEFYTDALGIKELYPIRSEGTDAIIIHPEFSYDSYWTNDSKNNLIPYPS